MKNYSIIIPAYNEEEGLEETVKRTVKNNPESEIILVDDGSNDNTWKIMKKMSKNKKIRIYSHKKNKGKAHALRTGYINAGKNIIATIDADRTYRPEDIPKLVEEFKKENYDLLVGSRFMEGIPENASITRSIANMTGSALASIILRRKVTDLTSGLRVMNKKVGSIEVKAHNLEYEAEITSRVISKGLKYGESPIKVEKREGESKLNFIKNCYLFIKAIIIGKFS